MVVSALILLGAAILVAIAFHSLKLPPVVAFITAGVLIGPHGLGLVPSMPQVGYVAEAAAILLMFTIGLEFSLKELTLFKRPILVLGLGQVFVTIVLFTFLFWFAFKFSFEKSLFLSFLIAPSSTAIVLKLLTDHRDLETPYGRGAISILLLQDIAVIPMIVVIPFLVQAEPLSTSFFASLLPLLLLGALVFLLIYVTSKYFLPFLLSRVSKTRNREIFFFTVVLICLGSAALMHQIGLSYSLGAFIAGMLLAGSHYGKQATAEILPLRDSFLSLFFVAIGMMLDLRFLFEHFHQILLVGLFITIFKCVVLFLVLWLSGSTSSVSRAVTVLLFQFGEFAFILADLGVNHNIIAEKERQFVVAIAIFTIAMTPLLYNKIQWFLDNNRFEDSVPKSILRFGEKLRLKILQIFAPNVSLDAISSHEDKDHVIIVGFGIAGQSLSRVFKHLDIKFTVIELNAETVRIHSDNLPIMYGDAANRELLKKAGIERARLVALVTSGINMLEPVLHCIRSLNPDVRILARTNYLQDLKRIPPEYNVSFIVSEMESTLELINQALREFDIAAESADEVVHTLRQELRLQSLQKV